MNAMVSDALRALSDNPILQGTFAAFCTFILEDPTTLGCALLVADGRMLYFTALVGLTLGIGFGDWGLYLAGRYLSPWMVDRGFVSGSRLDRIGAWFEENMFTAIMVSRFVPGLRLPANLAAGMTKASLRVYLPAALFASFIWTFLALTIISRLGEAILPLLGTFRWPFAVALIGGLMYVQRRSYIHMSRDSDSVAAEEAPASFFEFWHPIIFYAPVAFYYLLLAIRYRSLTLPTVANPSIYSGGMIRESKSEILDLVPAAQRRWIASHVSFVATEDEPLDRVVERVEASLADAGLELPVVAKPDQGQRGAGVRLVNTPEQLAQYVDDFPRGVPICLQELVPDPHEVGILYFRVPAEARGSITSITLKEFPVVVGDGRRTLHQLIDDHARARLMREVFFKRHEAQLGRVLDEGERFQLVFAGNHAQGCVFRDGMHLLSPALADRIDEIGRSIPDFFFGRFDLRFSDVESLQRGEGFKIVEINGAAAESTHIWDPDARLSDAYFTLFEQFRVLFGIGAANRLAGHRPLGPLQFLRDVILYHRAARGYPLAD